MKMNGEAIGQVSMKDMERLIEKAAQSAPAQTIRIEQAPLIIKADEPPVKPSV